jgi:hypothetical protein
MQLGDYIAMEPPRKRGTNVFWSGEQFMIRSETEGKPSSVQVQILSVDGTGNRVCTDYSTNLSKTGTKTTTGAEIWEGSLWDSSMINRWGRTKPEQLIFTFKAYYTGSMTKIAEATVIIDSDRDYWQLHRLW